MTDLPVSSPARRRGWRRTGLWAAGVAAAGVLAALLAGAVDRVRETAARSH